MRSPDPFSEDHDSNTSFEHSTPTTSAVRRRSEAIVAPEEESLDGFTESEQITVIENRPNETVLIEEDKIDFGEKRVNLDDTLTRLLESSEDEEDEGEEGTQNDALANLLKSFRDVESNGIPDEEMGDVSNISLDVFGDIIEDNGRREAINDIEDDIEEDVEERSFFRHAGLLPVDVPSKTNARKRHMESNKCKHSTSSKPSSSSRTLSSDGPVGVVSSDTGEYWNQPKTINIHGQTFEINSFNDYMRMKITKLNHQVNSEKSKPHEKVSETLKGYSVFVNGYTEPPALVIRDLMMAHSGEYHCYYQHGVTTYTIASSIATAKINRIRDKEIFIKADWITESIAAGKPLDYRDFLIYEKGAQENGQMQQFLTLSKSNNTETTTTSSTAPTTFSDARNPNFIRDYYARSRLHLISTLAQDMKDFVANLKMEGRMTDKCFPEEELNKMGENRNTTAQGNTVFHVDLDCFFVSVAVRDRKDLRKKEVAITHSKGTISNSMSEVASCSYAARSCGVKNGMLVRDALKKCPHLTLLPYQFDEYVQVSRLIYQILASYTLELRAVSCDEMYINMSRLCEKYRINDPTILAEHIRKIIREKTRCPVSIGIGSTSLLARLATRHAKPDGVFWITEEKKSEFMMEENVRDLPGLGYEMMSRLTSFFGDITKCSQLQLKSEKELIDVFGPKLASKIFKQCRGMEEDSEDFWRTHVRKSVSCDINYGIRFTKKEEVLQLMTAIGLELERKLTESKLIAGSITLKLMVRCANAPLQTAKFMGHGICDTFTKTCNLNVATTRGEILSSECMRLYAKVSPKVEDLRGVGVTCGKLKSKIKKDAATVVQQMFGKGRKEVMESDYVDLAPQGTIQPDSAKNEEEADRDIQKELSTQASSNQKVKRIPHPAEVHVSNETDIPDILKLSKNYITKSVTSYEAEEIYGDEKLSQKYTTELEEILQKKPTEENASSIYEMLSTLMSSGQLLTFEFVFQKFKEISMDCRLCHVNWFNVFHSMLPYLREESKSLLEFPIDLDRNSKNLTGLDSRKKRLVPCEIFIAESTKDCCK